MEKIVDTPQELVIYFYSQRNKVFFLVYKSTKYTSSLQSKQGGDMIKGMIKVVKPKIDAWLNCREWTQRQLADAVRYDEANLSKILNGELEPSKQLMKKLMHLTGLGVVLFYFDKDAAVSAEKPNA